MLQLECHVACSHPRAATTGFGSAPASGPLARLGLHREVWHRAVIGLLRQR
jgi:hypothetical protein